MKNNNFLIMYFGLFFRGGAIIVAVLMRFVNNAIYTREMYNSVK